MIKCDRWLQYTDTSELNTAYVCKIRDLSYQELIFVFS